MREIGTATEEEVVLAFLKAEIDSPRFGPTYVQILRNSQLDRGSLIDDPDLSNANDNRLRVELLSSVRGYRKGTFLFRGFPRDVHWRRAELLPEHVRELKYANFPTWTHLSKGSRLVADGSANIDTVQTDENAEANIKAVAAAILAGQRYPELIAVEDVDKSLILVEGHTRATAYVLVGFEEPVSCFVGSSPSMHLWAFY